MTAAVREAAAVPSGAPDIIGDKRYSDEYVGNAIRVSAAGEHADWCGVNNYNAPYPCNCGALGEREAQLVAANKRLREICERRDRMLVHYRTGSLRAPGKLIDQLKADREWLAVYDESQEPTP